MKSRYAHARLITCAACISMLSGCASWTPPVAPDARPSAEDAYLYGRFTIAAAKSSLAFDGYSTIGFMFKCADGSLYTVRFRLENDVQLLRVKPSTCSLDQTIYTDGDGHISQHEPSPAGLMKALKLQAGMTYYVGDFHGSARSTGLTRIQMDWRIDSASDLYGATTAALKARYPAFSTYPTQDAMRSVAY